MRTINLYYKDKVEAMHVTRDLYDLKVSVALFVRLDDPRPYVVTNGYPNLNDEWSLVYNPRLQDLIETKHYTGLERRRSTRTALVGPVKVERLDI